MTGSGNYIHLLLFGQINELNRIAGYTDCKVRIFRLFRMFHCIDQLFCTEYIHIQMMCSAIKIAIENICQVLASFFLCVSKCTRIYGLGIGDSIKCILIWKLCNGVQ